MAVSHSEYLVDMFAGHKIFRKALLRAKRKIEKEIKSGLHFTHIAVSGVSGCVFGGALAMMLKKDLIVVRKDEENSHAQTRVEGCPLTETISYLFVDDFISMGNTLRRVHKKIRDINPKNYCVGVYQYHNNHDRFYDGYQYILE